MFKKGDKVFFIGDNSKYSWELNKYEEYEISTMSYRMEVIPHTNGQLQEVFYFGVKDKKGTETTWYDTDAFLTIKQLRKVKLEKLHENL